MEIDINNSNNINLNNSETNFSNQKRGRGRPRKNQIMNDGDKSKKNKNINEIKKFVKELDDKNSEDEIILHLPIFMKDVEMNQNKNQNNNNNSDDIFCKLSKNSNNSNNESNNVDDDKNIFTINDINDLDVSYDMNSNSSVEVDPIYLIELKQTIKSQEKHIKFLEKEIEEYKNILSETTNNSLNERHATKMKGDFIMIDDNTGNTIITEKTDIACWWCTYNFDSMPCFIPDKFQNDKYHVFGCFCSYNCAAAYNLKMDDSCVWNRYSLLKKMYNQIFQNSDEIGLAPPREVFEKFGGPLKHEDFVKNSKKCNKEYRFIMPPMAPIVPIIEEGRSDNQSNVKLSDLNRKNIILKRTKPLPNSKNTLLETLGIKSSKS